MQTELLAETPERDVDSEILAAKRAAVAEAFDRLNLKPTLEEAFAILNELDAVPDPANYVA